MLRLQSIGFRRRNLVRGAQYCARVAQVNAIGEGQFSAPSSIITFTLGTWMDTEYVRLSPECILTFDFYFRERSASRSFRSGMPRDSCNVAGQYRDR